MRLPNIRKPTRATDLGATRPAITVTTIGKRILVVFETSPGLYFILIKRSFLVVTALITGG